MSISITNTMEMLDTILNAQPILNMNLNFCYIPRQIIALKCLLFTGCLQAQNNHPKDFILPFSLLFSACILYSLQLKDGVVLRGILDYGIVFSVTYLAAITDIHEPFKFRDFPFIPFSNLWCIKDFTTFMACVLWPRVEAYLDFCIIVMSINCFFSLNNKRDFIMFLRNVMLGCKYFIVLWWSLYSYSVHCVYQVILFQIMDILPSDFDPRVFWLTLVWLISYRFFGGTVMFI